jgi:hypothetical protein
MDMDWRRGMRVYGGVFVILVSDGKGCRGGRAEKS